MPYRAFLRFSYPLLAVTVVLLVAVFAFPPRNGARRWVPLGLFYFQPSEVAKIAFILALAAYLRFRDNFRTLPGLVPPFAIALVPMGLILVEPDLGTSLLFIPVLGAMLFAAGARRLPYSVIGLLQYLAPTIQFGLAITLFGEVVTTAHLICFALIWSGLAVFVVGSLRARKV